MGRSWLQALGFEVYLFCRGEQLVPLACSWQSSNRDLCFSYQVADFSSLGHFLMFRNVIPPLHPPLGALRAVRSSSSGSIYT